MSNKRLEFQFILSDAVKEANKLEVDLNVIFNAFKLPEEELVKVTWSNSGVAYYTRQAVEKFLEDGNWRILH